MNRNKCKEIKFKNKQGKELCYMYRYGLTTIMNSCILHEEESELVIFKNCLLELNPIFIVDNEYNTFSASFFIVKEFDFNIFKYLKAIEEKEILPKNEFQELINEITLQFDYNEEYIKELYSEIKN